MSLNPTFTNPRPPTTLISPMNPVTASQPQLAMFAGIVMLYVAGRAAVNALTHRAASPGWRAVGHWLPIAAVTGAAIYLQQPELALAVIFSTSVAALALSGGAVALMEPAGDEPQDWPAKTSSVSALLLPAALLTLLAGFAGQINWLSELMLAAEGVLLLYVWRDPADKATAAKPSINALNLCLAVLLCAVGAWITVKAALAVSRRMDFPLPTLTVTTALAPLLIAPMLIGGTNLVQRGQAWAATATHVGVAQLNLCLLLPAAGLAWQLRSAAPMHYPLVNWRIDAVVLLVLGSFVGRQRPGRIEGLVLMGIYAAYVLTGIVVTLRQSGV